MINTTDLMLRTSEAALALGLSTDTLKRKRESQGGFLEAGFHYFYGDCSNSPIIWNVQRCREAFHKRGLAARKARVKGSTEGGSSITIEDRSNFIKNCFTPRGFDHANKKNS